MSVDSAIVVALERIARACERTADRVERYVALLEEESARWHEERASKPKDSNDTEELRYGWPSQQGEG